MNTVEKNDPPVEEVVKGLILAPDYESAVRYIYQHKEILFSDSARGVFDKIITTNGGEFGKQVQSVLDLLDQCRVIKLDEMLARRKGTEIN